VDLDWSEGDVLEVLLLIDGEGFDAVDVEVIVALVMAAMTVPELSNRKRNKAIRPMTTIALLSVEQLSGTGLASFLGFFPFRPRCIGVRRMRDGCRLCWIMDEIVQGCRKHCGRLY
jgi:hypothetical protein